MEEHKVLKTHMHQGHHRNYKVRYLWKVKMQPQEIDHQILILHEKPLQFLLQQQLLAP